MSEWAIELQKRLSVAADKERAKQMEAYMRDLCPYYGVMSTPRREIFRGLIKDLGVPENGVEVCKELFVLPKRECHYVAQELMLRVKKQWQVKDIDTLEWMITINSWWDTVDNIASNLVGTYFKIFPDDELAITSKWNKSTNMWLVRTSILYQLKYKEQTNQEALANFILPHIHNKEFFIRKAIGWALREYAKTNKDWVWEFVNKTELKPLSRKEALKHF
jgi:3-methyladenine DNA glycosylase AlkD